MFACTWPEDGRPRTDYHKTEDAAQQQADNLKARGIKLATVYELDDAPTPAVILAALLGSRNKGGKKK